MGPRADGREKQIRPKQANLKSKLPRDGETDRPSNSTNTICIPASIYL